MANVFGILTFIVLGLTCFVANTNKTKYEAEIITTQEEKGKLAESRKRLTTAQDTLTATIAKRTGVDEENVKLTATETEQKKTNADLKSQVADKTSKASSNKEKLDDIRAKTSKVGDLKELASKMRQTKADLEELAQSIGGTEAKLANLTALNTQTEGSANGMKKKFEIYSSVQSLPTLNTRIRTIFPTWGFVTLASGNNAGVVANSTLEVVRDGAVIAKLLVSAVESSSASASIVPDSIAQDVTLMVGDKVVASTKAEQPEKN